MMADFIVRISTKEVDDDPASSSEEVVPLCCGKLCSL